MGIDQLTDNQLDAFEAIGPVRLAAICDVLARPLSWA
jgi:hypothetical protein